jgi:hypothetical protein
MGDANGGPPWPRRDKDGRYAAEVDKDLGFWNSVTIQLHIGPGFGFISTF